MFEPWSASDQPFKNPYILVENPWRKLQEQELNYLKSLLKLLQIILLFIKRFYLVIFSIIIIGDI